MRNTLLLIFLLIAVSCNNSGVNINKDIIKRLAEGDFKIPSKHGFLFLFISIGNNVKVTTNINILHEVYMRYYIKSYKDFEGFLSHAMNQKIQFSAEQLKNSGTPFKLDSVITAKYTDSSLPEFIEHHFDETDNEDELVVKEKYVNDKYLYSVLYYSFINNYQVSADDYFGKYFVKKIRSDK